MASGEPEAQRCARIGSQVRCYHVRLFGSVARREESDGSDIDLVADLPETTSLLELIALRRLLGELS